VSNFDIKNSGIQINRTTIIIIVATSGKRMMFSQYFFSLKQKEKFCFQILVVSIVFVTVNEEELQMSGSRWTVLYFFVCPFFAIHMPSVQFPFILVLIRLTRLTRRSLSRFFFCLSFVSNHIVQHNALRLNFNKSL
jgi:hypothetical protein